MHRCMELLDQTEGVVALLPVASAGSPVHGRMSVCCAPLLFPVCLMQLQERASLAVGGDVGAASLPQERVLERCRPTSCVLVFGLLAFQTALVVLDRRSWLPCVAGHLPGTRMRLPGVGTLTLSPAGPG